MEWLVFVALIAVAAALIGARLPVARARTDDTLATIEAQRAALLAELAELDDDAAAGRITGEDRLAGRRALAPRLRAVTESARAARLTAEPPR